MPLEELELDAVNTAAYSVRSGTVAANLVDDIPDQVKQDRLHKIMKVVDASALKNNEKLVGTTQSILVERVLPPKKIRGVIDTFAPLVYSGRTRTNKIVKFSSNSTGLIGELVDVRIKSALSWVLEGELV